MLSEGEGMARKKGTVEKPKTDRKRKTVNQQKTDKKRKMLFGIRNKIMIGFLVPVLFMVVIGVVSPATNSTFTAPTRKLEA